MFPNWSTNADTAIREALEAFALERLGWKGFEDLAWVRALREMYPDMARIATNTSTISGVLIDQVEVLFNRAEACDRPAIRSYFLAKLALEKLSLARNGAGAGMGDKYGAYLQIFDRINCIRSPERK